MGNSCNYCEQYTRFQRRQNVKVLKPSNPFTNVCWVSVFSLILSALPQILAARQFSSFNSRTGCRMGDGFFGALPSFV